MAIMSSFINANDTGEALNVVEFGIDSIVFSLYVARNHEQSANWSLWAHLSIIEAARHTLDIDCT
jgi:hypothetical protein